MLPQEAERLRKEAEEEAARQRKVGSSAVVSVSSGEKVQAAAAEAERLRQAGVRGVRPTALKCCERVLLSA